MLKLNYHFQYPSDSIEVVAIRIDYHRVRIDLILNSIDLHQVGT